MDLKLCGRKQFKNHTMHADQYMEVTLISGELHRVYPSSVTRDIAWRAVANGHCFANSLAYYRLRDMPLSEGELRLMAQGKYPTAVRYELKTEGPTPVTQVPAEIVFSE
jgi:hypothetical protein